MVSLKDEEIAMFGMDNKWTDKMYWNAKLLLYASGIFFCLLAVKHPRIGLFALISLGWLRRSVSWMDRKFSAMFDELGNSLSL